MADQIPAALESAAASMRALHPPRRDADLFNAIPAGLSGEEGALLRDFQHTTAGVRAQTAVMALIRRTPYLQTDKGRSFASKLNAILSDLSTLP